MKDKLKDFLQSLLNEQQQSKKLIYLVGIAAVALFLLVFGNSMTPKEKNKDEPLQEPFGESTQETAKTETIKEFSMNDWEEGFERSLKDMLEKIQGVSEVDVMINLDSTDIKIYEKNLIKSQQTTNESDVNGGTRKIEDLTEDMEIVLVRQGDQEVPLLVQIKKPKVRGVFVVAKGVEQATVKMGVIEAVSKVLDVPSHKVSVMPKN